MIIINENKSNDEKLINHKQQALNTLDNYITDLINSDNSNINGKADKLCYWLEDYVKFLSFENDFSPKSLRRYKRGEIIKAHLGYNIGSEEGGLHFCVVLDKNNALSSPVITVVPLTSVKPHTDITKLHKGSVYLGNELFTNVSAKKTQIIKIMKIQINTLNEIKNSNNAQGISKEELEKEILKLRSNMKLLTKTYNDLSKMKTGSIALVNQITTISKIRIYDPKTNHDVLSNVKLSNEKLDAIDNAIREQYTNL